MSQDLPIVGAAVTCESLDDHLEWILTDQRDLEIQDFAVPELLDSDKLAEHIHTIKIMLENHTGRLGIHAPFWNLDLAVVDCKIRAVVQERFCQSLDICAELGATHMVIHSPLKFLGETASFTHPHIGNWDLFEIAHETLRPIVQKAESIGCMLVIENVFDHSPELLTRLVASFESDCVRQSLDVGHAFINYKHGAPPPDYYVREAGKFLAHIHLQDTDGFTDRHWAIGEGSVNWAEMFRAIAELKQQPRLILELRDHDKIPQSYQWLQAAGFVR